MHSKESTKIEKLENLWKENPYQPGRLIITYHDFEKNYTIDSSSFMTFCLRLFAQKIIKQPEWSDKY